MRIELNYQADSLEAAICEAIVAHLAHGMPAREIIDQLISRGIIRDPGNNAREDVAQRLSDMGEQMRREGAGAVERRHSVDAAPSRASS
jgi:hypothetical protein